VFEANQISLQELMKKKGLSKPTVLKITDLLEKARLIKTVKRKPKIVSINLNDASFFYANFLDLSFDSFQKTFTFPNIKKIESKRISEQLIRLHAYSTTVTEGNTATEDDVRKIFDNHPVKLTPREITEILNARRAIDHLYEICNNDVSLFELKKIHEILMDNLVENAGEFFYGTKRVIGSETRFPTAKEEIDIMIISLLSFWNKNIRALNPLLLGTLVHFMFVTIHPFADGNGRVARLLHSWVLLKSKLPLFVYHVNKKNTYFDLIERGRKESIDNFVKFCSDEYSNCLIDIDGRIHQ
jgi:fido (protein-threonine AMPylation protein)